MTPHLCHARPWCGITSMFSLKFYWCFVFQMASHSQRFCCLFRDVGGGGKAEWGRREKSPDGIIERVCVLIQIVLFSEFIGRLLQVHAQLSFFSQTYLACYGRQHLLRQGRFLLHKCILRVDVFCYIITFCRVWRPLWLWCDRFAYEQGVKTTCLRSALLLLASS